MSNVSYGSTIIYEFLTEEKYEKIEKKNRKMIIAISRYIAKKKERVKIIHYKNEV